MMHMEERKVGYGMFGCCGPWYMKRSHSCGIGFGIMLILAGILWLASKMGWFNPELFWPSAILAVGVMIVAFTLTRGRRLRINHRQNKEV